MVLEHPRNTKIEFDVKNHKYYYKKTVRSKVEEFTGVTGWIGSYCEPFQRDKIATNYGKRYGMSKQEVLDLWQGDQDYGSRVHLSIENLVKFGIIDDSVELEYFMEALAQENLVPIDCEWVVYDEEIKKASPIDLICERDDKLVVVDIKTMKKPIRYTPYGNANKKMVYPLNGLPDSKFYKQNLQTNIYRYWLNKHYNVPVDLTSYIFRINDQGWEVLPCLELSNYVEKMYNE